MDDRDLHEIQLRILALDKGLEQLDILSNIYQKGTANLAGFEITLSASQKTKVHDQSLAIATRLEALADSLPAFTGKAGTPDRAVLDQIAASPAKAVRVIREFRTIIQVILKDMVGQEQPDKSYRMVFSDADAEDIANRAATANGAARLVIAVLKTRMQ